VSRGLITNTVVTDSLGVHLHLDNQKPHLPSKYEIHVHVHVLNESSVRERRVSVGADGIEHF
jgi:hypothetical protein